MLKILKFEEFNDELKVFWKSLEKTANISFFQTFEWNKLWYSKVKNYKIKLCILVLKYNNEVSDILPLCLERKYFLNKLVFAGGLNTDFKNIISSNKSYFRIKNFNQNDFIKFLENNCPKFNYISFENMLDNNTDNLNVLSLFCNLKKNNINHRVNLKELSFELYLSKNLNKKFINDIKRQIRRLKQIGKLKFIILKDNLDINKYSEIMIKLKSEQYKNSGGGLFDINGYKEIYQDYIKDEKNYKSLHLSALLIDDKIISVHYGFLFNRTLYYVMPAYDVNWYQYSPGNVLLFYLIKECFARNYNYLDFTDGDNKYKKNWSNFSYNMFEFVYSKSIIVNIFLYLIKKVRYFKSKLN